MIYGMLISGALAGIWMLLCVALRAPDPLMWPPSAPTVVTITLLAIYLVCLLGVMYQAWAEASARRRRPPLPRALALRGSRRNARRP